MPRMPSKPILSLIMHVQLLRVTGTKKQRSEGPCPASIIRYKQKVAHLLPAASESVTHFLPKMSSSATSGTERRQRKMHQRRLSCEGCGSSAIGGYSLAIWQYP